MSGAPYGSQATVTQLPDGTWNIAVDAVALRAAGWVPASETEHSHPMTAEYIAKLKRERDAARDALHRATVTIYEEGMQALAHALRRSGGLPEFDPGSISDTSKPN